MDLGKFHMKSRPVYMVDLSWLRHIPYPSLISLSLDTSPLIPGMNNQSSRAAEGPQGRALQGLSFSFFGGDLLRTIFDFVIDF